MPPAEDELTEGDLQALLRGGHPCVYRGRRSAGPLTHEQILIVQCASQGMTREMTVEVSGLKLENIKQHWKEIRRKLACKNKTHAVAECIRQGFID
jgi:DNA-binding CsgD family transcriptional regulator